MKDWHGFAFLLASLTACTTFEPIARDTCGNGILEPGEDCDSTAASCVRCAVTCTTAADCPTTDYACGVDGFCHAPGGALGPAVTVGTFLVDDYRITDIDRDRIGDVVGLSKTSIVVRHGDPSATLAKADSQITPSQSGPAAFGDLDGDGALDIAIATPDGLVSYASPYGTLSPLDVKSEIRDSNGNPLDIRMGFPVGQLTLGVFIVMSGQVVFGVIDFSNVNNVVGAVPCAAMSPAQFDPSLVDVYRESKDTDIATDTVVALVSAGKLCVLAVHKNNVLATPTITNITPTNPPALTKKPVLADLHTGGDKCPDVVTTEAGVRGLRHWTGAMGLSGCTLNPSLFTNGDALAPITQAPASDDAIGHAAIDPVQPGAAPDALVATESVWATNGSQWGLLYGSTRKLQGAFNADLNGDGWSDIVLSAVGSDDLDVLYRSSALLAQYELYRVDTAAVVTSVSIADFDTDGFKDIAYTEQLSDHQRMMIAYGTSTRVEPPIEVGTFSGILSVAPVSVAIPLAPALAFLLVLQPPLVGGTTPTLTFLQGSPQRTMIPYFDPRIDTNSTIFRSVVIGNFAPTPGGGPPFEDLVGIASTRPSSGMALQVSAWLVAGVQGGLDSTKSNGVVVNGLGDCALHGTIGFCYEEASYLSWPASAMRDTVVAIDHQAPAHAVFVDPAASTSSVGAMPVSALTSVIPSGDLVRAMYATDADGDGKLDLVASFQPGPGTSATGALLVCQVDANGMPQSCIDLSSTIQATNPMTTACYDAAPGHFAYRDPTTPADASTELVALCRDDGATMYRISHDGSGFHADVLGHSTADLSALRIGDINGDGLDDVVAVAGDRGSQTLVVFPQCSSRTLATCQLGAGGNP